MKKEKIDSLPIQVFYTSKEETNCPLISDLLRIAKTLKQKKILQNKKGVTISFTYGKRILINSIVQDFSNIKREELLEIADYDPIKNNLLVIGKADPKSETTLHFMIHHAREDIKIIVQIKNDELLEKIKNKIPILDENLPINSIEFIKKVLKELRDSKIVGIKDDGILFVGKKIDEIDSLITSFYEE